MTDLERALTDLNDVTECLQNERRLFVAKLAAARREGIEAAIAVLHERVKAYRRVRDYTAADLVETNADCIRDILLLDPEESI